MIKGLAGATIWSEDLNRLLPFYRDTLGLAARVTIPGFVVFGEAEQPALALGTHSEVHGPNGDPARHMVGLLSDDVTKDWKRLKAAGVPFIEAAYRLRQLPHSDPEGSRGQPGPAPGAPPGALNPGPGATPPAGRGRRCRSCASAAARRSWSRAACRARR